MKQITCPAMGGPGICTTVFTGSTPEEIVANAMKHVEEAHPEMVAGIKAMSKEENDKWMTGVREKFAALPELPTA
jgi:hypothetical protein